MQRQSQRPKLKIGILVDSMQLPAWQCRMLQLVMQAGYAEIVLVIVRSVPAGIGRPPPEFEKGRGIRLAKRLLATVQRQLVDKIAFLPDASELLDASDLLAGIAVLPVTHQERKDFDSIVPADLDSVREARLDVLIQLGFRLLEGGILQCAKYGVWSHHYSGDKAHPFERPGFWEAMESKETVSTELHLLRQSPDRNVVLYHSLACTNDRALRDNTSNAYWKSSHFVPRVLRDLYEHNDATDFVNAKSNHSLAALTGDTPYVIPSTATMMRLLLRKISQRVTRKLRDIFWFEQWFLLYDLSEEFHTSLARYERLVPPKDRFWADPFVILQNDRFYIFFEELLYSTNRGHIALLEMARDGNFTQPIKVLERPYHLSYPFIFEFRGILYMVPESAANRTIELYRCVEFPLKWKFEMNLMEECVAVDSTLFEHHGKWWLFANQVKTQGASTWDELHLYYSESPLSSHWIPHPKNPVVSDVASARPAGRVFSKDGKLYRPSQNCSGHYGYGLNICEIAKISEAEYEERVVTKIVPTWDKQVVSTHTFNFVKGMTVADGQLRRRRK